MSYSLKDYQRERAICDKANAYWQANASFSRNGASSVSRELTQHPDYAACDNAMRGRVEKFELLRDMPERFTAYLSSDMRRITVWTGDELGPVHIFNEWTSNFGDKRQAGTATIGNAQYSVLAFGAGMYCHLRKLKAKRDRDEERAAYQFTAGNFATN